jgi:hypothetical protein
MCAFLRPILRLRSALAFGFAIAALSSASGQTAAPIPPVPAPVNLAQFATATASYVSGDTTLAALNSGFDPRNSRDGTHGTYGNWNRTTTQWVEYDWSQPISTARIEVYWWNDRGGIGYPSACRLLYWDGTQFTPVANPTDTTSATEGGLGLAGDRYNVTAFAPVTTTRLRLEIDPSGNRTGNGISTGIVQWKVIDTGQSPKFPPTVIAGVDRVVVLPGQTYLNAKVLGASPTRARSPPPRPFLRRAITRCGSPRPAAAWPALPPASLPWNRPRRRNISNRFTPRLTSSTAPCGTTGSSS